jgi:high-affinity iron transporter
MFSVSVVVFREVLEISLILITLLAATRGLSGRTKWIVYGLIGGVTGSCVVAYGADAISSFAEGIGQELFNAGVLVSASILIGWTVIWMRRHGREMSRHLKELAQEVNKGEKPLMALTIVIALAVLREGSEIVLFTYGFLASGENLLSIVAGEALGLAAGIGVGVCLYYGLVSISTRFLFSFTSWLLIFLAAGMISQATGLLQAGGVLPVFISQLWDSSMILSEQSFIGSVFHTLIGYTSRPSFIQVISYVISLVCLIVFLKLFGKKSQIKIVESPAV